MPVRGTLDQVKRGFTLIEVLVVVSIIALLTAILLPSLKGARDQAYSTKCKAQLKELGTGMTTYRSVFDTFPPHKFTGVGPGGEGTLDVRWFHLMAREMGSRKAWLGTNVEDFEVANCSVCTDWEVGRNNSYGYNYKFLGSMRTNSENYPTPEYENFPVKTIRSTSRTIAFGDCDGTGNKLPHRNKPKVGEDDNDWKNWERFGNHGYTMDPTFIAKYSESAVNNDGDPERYAWHEYRTYASNRHGGKGNFCFVDGHVAAMRPREIYIDNRYWNGLGGATDTRTEYVDYHYIDGDWIVPGIDPVRGSASP